MEYTLDKTNHTNEKGFYKKKYSSPLMMSNTG